MPGIIKVVDRYTPQMVQNALDDIFIFGDNLIREGTGGQAIIRGNENILGIPTKRLPSMNDDAFFSDRDDEMIAVKDALDEINFLHSEGYNIVLPADGIGTGYAKLSEKSPQIFAVIDTYIKALMAIAVSTSSVLKVNVVHKKNYGDKSHFMNKEKSVMYVYCGRPSKLSNPYTMEDESQREMVITQFSTNLPMKDINGLYDYCIKEGVKELYLGCYCAPKPCHCDVIKKQLHIIDNGCA